MKQEIKRFVKTNSYFDYERGNSTDTELAFSTREHGDMMNDEYGDEDWGEGMAIKKKLEDKFGDQIEVEIEGVDEWVLLDIKIL